MKPLLSFFVRGYAGAKKIPHLLFHISPASACVVLLVMLLFLLPVLIDLVKGIF